MGVKSAAEREDRLVVVRLAPHLRRSGRQQARSSPVVSTLLSIGMALLADPRLIILDEPSLGIAPASPSGSSTR